MVVYGRGRVRQRVQRGAVGLGRCRYMFLHAFVGVRNARSLLFTRSGKLLSYMLGFDCAWYVYGPGRVHQRVQRVLPLV